MLIVGHSRVFANLTSRGAQQCEKLSTISHDPISSVGVIETAPERQAELGLVTCCIILLALLILGTYLQASRHKSQLVGKVNDDSKESIVDFHQRRIVSGLPIVSAGRSLGRSCDLSSMMVAFLSALERWINASGELVALCRSRRHVVVG